MAKGLPLFFKRMRKPNANIINNLWDSRLIGGQNG